MTKKQSESSLLNVYGRWPISISHGKGPYVYDVHGKEYLDFGCGIAVSNLGHCHPYLVEKLKDQIDLLWHCSNIFTFSEQERLAKRLCELTFADKIFFCSSGLEAVETAIKIMRKFGHDLYSPKKNKILSLKGGFHGRSYACLSAGGNEHARKGFGPLLEGFVQIERENLDELEKNLDENVCGILIEPVQSEGGVWPLNVEYLKKVREIAVKNDVLLCFDEVQTGFGRTGALFHHQKIDVIPDLMTCAKGIGNGFPLAACFVNEKAAKVMSPGTHGSTYGGNPMGMAAGHAVLDVMTQKGFFENVSEISEIFLKKLESLKEKYGEIIEDVRGEGFIFGVELKKEFSCDDFMQKCFKLGLAVTKAGGGKVIRILPPLVIEKKHVIKAYEIMDLVCEELMQ